MFENYFIAEPIRFKTRAPSGTGYVKKEIRNIPVCKCACGSLMINTGDGFLCNECIDLIFEHTYLQHWHCSLELILREIKKNSHENRIIRLFADLRNPAYDRTGLKKYILPFVPIFGNKKEFKEFTGVKPIEEHINGRNNIGVYAILAMHKHEIFNSETMKQFYASYATQIYTCKKFNNYINGYIQNTGDGAPYSWEYIKSLEDFYKIKLDEDIKKNLANHFLADKYGKITKYDVIKFIRDDLYER